MNFDKAMTYFSINNGKLNLVLQLIAIKQLLITLVTDNKCKNLSVFPDVILFTLYTIKNYASDKILNVNT